MQRFLATITASGHRTPANVRNGPIKSAVSFSLAGGTNNGNALTVNGVAGSRTFGGVMTSHIEVTETAPLRRTEEPCEWQGEKPGSHGPARTETTARCSC